jgi:hemerythrin-like domain-containing protein
MKVSVTMLQYEHGLIRQVTDVLGEMCKRSLVERYLEDAKEITAFLGRFMDGFHHAKEERFLFPAALRCGALRPESVDHLIMEHKAARECVVQMEGALRKGRMPLFYEQARKLVHHMTHHIMEEENEFFPRIEERLDAEEDMRVYKEFEAFMASSYGEDFYRVTESFAQTVQDDILGPGYFERTA